MTYGIQLVPLGSTLSDLFAKAFRLELVPELRLGGDVDFEFLDQLPRIVRQVVEALLLEIAESAEG